MALADARLFHVNVNCSDLGRSRSFYAEGLGLGIGAHTAPETTQPGGAFGLDEARWDASILLGPRGYDGGAIDLLQWHEPRPVGAPPARLYQTGFQRLGLRVADLDAAIANTRAFGGAVWSDPVVHTVGPGREIRIVLANDPDGTAIEFVEGELPNGEPQNGATAALSFVAVTCADLEAARGFYADLGFREVARFPSENADGAHLHVDGAVAMDEIAMTAPGGGDVLLMLVGFRTPTCESDEPRPANALGMWRTAFLVSDLDAAVAELARMHIATISDPVAMEMGPGLPTLRFMCFRGPNAEVIELIEQPS
jgi:catechol 2,3-dioxygenase-like lactoylglutathione lyase family enzyme